MKKNKHDGLHYLSPAIPEGRQTFANLYKSLPDDLYKLVSDIKENPDIGVHLGNGVRKVRFSITSKNKGKSGSARVVTFKRNTSEDGTVTLLFLTMYDKNEVVNVSNSYIKYLISTEK